MGRAPRPGSARRARQRLSRWARFVCPGCDAPARSGARHACSRASRLSCADDAAFRVGNPDWKIMLRRNRVERLMKRRTFLKKGAGALGVAAGSVLAANSIARAALPKMKIARVLYYEQPNARTPTFNQSANIVVIETDAGITGVGDGGTRDMVEQCAAMLIGEDPSRID